MTQFSSVIFYEALFSRARNDELSIQISPASEVKPTTLEAIKKLKSIECAAKNIHGTVGRKTWLQESHKISLRQNEDKWNVIVTDQVNSKNWNDVVSEKSKNEKVVATGTLEDCAKIAIDRVNMLQPSDHEIDKLAPSAAIEFIVPAQLPTLIETYQKAGVKVPGLKLRNL